jgi:antitoxin component YwqK of YwqJK toxin-antitoxin module
MRSLLLLLVPCLILAWPADLTAQPDPDTSQWPDGRPGEQFNVTDAAGLKQGRWIRVYPDGKLYYSGSFQDGRPVGHFTFFRESGRVLSEVEHDSENNIAKAILYREDGTPSHQGQYRTLKVDGEWTQRKTGVWEALDKQGRIRLKEHYLDDQLDGPQQTFHSSGQLLEEGQFNQGRKTGLWKAYDRSGNPRSVEMWLEGERHGEAKVMQDGGALLSKGTYAQGIPIGAWTTYNPNGKERARITYEEGRMVKEEPLNGEFEAHYPSGRPEWVARYAFGRLDGPFTAWHDLGEWVMAPADASPGQSAGPPGFAPQTGSEQNLRRELRNQPKKEMGEYTAGVKDGTWRYFDEQGGLLRTERWALGKLTATEE